MKVFGDKVLIEQKVTRKISAIFKPGGKNAAEETVTFKVVAVGKDVVEAQVGDVPIFGQHVQFHGLKVVSKSKEEDVLHVIVYEGDILGADDEQPTQEVIETKEENINLVKE